MKWHLAILLVCVIGFASSECLNNCSGHGACTSDGRCVCESGWSGQDCSVYSCTTGGCSGQGMCRENGCVCFAGFEGTQCNIISSPCPNNCKGHGICKAGVCECERGFTDIDCGLLDPLLSCPNNCTGHGFCDTTLEIPTCFCMPGFWGGPACDIELSRCPVELNNCTGHGICESQAKNGNPDVWACACETGFCGSTCNKACPSCPNNCTGHGLCFGTECRCSPGFAGADCSTVVGIPECPNNCSGHGQCKDLGSGYGCVCDPGFEGTSCLYVRGLCPRNCSGKGECLPSGRCACIAGYNGTGCERALGTCLANNNCSGNGVCRSGVCHCYPGFSGTDCSQACLVGGIGNIGCNADKGHGTCLNGTCVCREGEWEGASCEIQSHSTTLGQITSANNPIGIIVLSIVAVAAVLILGAYGLNYMKGKRGVKALPGGALLGSSVKGDDYDAAPENRFASNY